MQPVGQQGRPAIDDVLHVLTDDEVNAILAEAATSGRVLAAGHLGGLGTGATD